MAYIALPTNLHGVADNVVKFLRDDYGVKAIEIEKSIDDHVEWRPTISGKATDYHTVCVEVTDSGYTDALDSAVVQCMMEGLPVKMYLAVPTDEINSSEMMKTVRRAKTRGLGIIEVKEKSCKLLQPAIACSLSAVRPVDPKRFAPKRRQAVADAYQTYLNGDPAKGCSRVYDEIESLSRRFAARAVKESWWTTNLPLSPTTAWATIMRQLIDGLNLAAANAVCANRLSIPLLQSIAALTGPRNDAGHKPNSRAKLVARDRELRTRFEHAVDVLAQLDEATRSLRL